MNVDGNKTKSKSKGKASVVGTDYKPVKWSNIRISDEDSSAVYELAENPDILASKFVAMALDGKAIFAKWKADNQAFTVGFTCEYPHDPGYNFGLSAFADELPLALASFFYKWEVLLECEVPELETREKRSFG